MMIKRSFIPCIAFSAILLTVLMIPTVRANFLVMSCICDHFNVSAENGYYDEYTATGIEGSSTGAYFDWLNYTFQRGLGGYYSPAPPYVNLMDVYGEWIKNGDFYWISTTWNYPYPGYDSYGTWQYPYYGLYWTWPYHAQTYYYYTSNIDGTTYVGASTGSYFPWPPYPYAMWYDDGGLTWITKDGGNYP